MNQGLNYVKQRETLRKKFWEVVTKKIVPRNIQILESRRRGGELCKVNKKEFHGNNFYIGASGILFFLTSAYSA